MSQAFEQIVQLLAKQPEILLKELKGAEETAEGGNPFGQTKNGGFNNGFTTFESSFGGNTGVFGGGAGGNGDPFDFPPQPNCNITTLLQIIQ